MKKKLILAFISIGMLFNIIGCEISKTSKSNEKESNIAKSDILEYSKNFDINSIYFYTKDNGIKISNKDDMEKIYSVLKETSYVETTSKINEDNVSYRIFLCENSAITRETITIQGDIVQTLDKTYKMEKDIDSKLKKTFKELSKSDNCVTVGKYDGSMMNSVLTEQSKEELDKLKEKEEMRDKYLEEN